MCVGDFLTTSTSHPAALRTPFSAGGALHGLSPALRYLLALKNQWEGLVSELGPSLSPCPSHKRCLSWQMCTGTFLSSRNEAGNASNLYLSHISLSFSHTESSLFMLRVVFVPFDSYSQGSLSFESVSCFREGFPPPPLSDLFTDPS